MGNNSRRRVPMERIKISLRGLPDGLVLLPPNMTAEQRQHFRRVAIFNIDMYLAEIDEAPDAAPTAGGSFTSPASGDDEIISGHSTVENSE